MSQIKKDFKLVEVHGQKLTVTSLVVSELFGRPHKNVLRALDGLISRLNIEFRNFTDSRGKTQRMAILTERQFLIAMPFIGGTKSFEGQVKLVDEFLRLQKVLSDPSRKEAIQYKRDTHIMMQDMKLAIMERDGLKWTDKEAMKENFFCNRALTGLWAAIDESTLDAYDARLLGKIRDYNVILIGLYGKKQDARKVPMDDFVTEYRIKHPRLQLVLK
jgi:phage regulator Rha-like protein